LKANFLRNKKGVAEIVGTLLFIIILLFFFTNVYLWHDAATKQMDDLYVQKLNSPIVIYAYHTPIGTATLNVTNRGGVDATLSMVWTNFRSAGGVPDPLHYSNSTSELLNNQVLAAGTSKNITISIQKYVAPETVVFTVVTTVGNMASCSYTPGP
jgi:hypothetical protein